MPHTLRRIVVLALSICAIAAACVSPAAASVEFGRMKFNAAAHTQKTKPTVCDTAQVVRRAVVKKYTKQFVPQFGKKRGRELARRKPGLDICRYGMKHGKKPSRLQKVRYLHTLQRLKNPPTSPAVTASVAVANSQPAVSPQSAGAASGVLPACASESGTNYSTGPDNTNPSGATGRYQEMPEHRQPGGVCYGIDLSPTGQDKCAVLIYRSQGAGAWVGCG
jgi:hypothetical protein